MNRCEGQRPNTTRFEYGGYLYHVFNKDKGVYRCQSSKKKINKCPVWAHEQKDKSVKLTANGEEVTNDAHSHPKPTLNERQHVLRKIQRLAKENPYGNRRYITVSAYAECADVVLPHHSRDAEKKVVSRARKHCAPTPPKCLEDVDEYYANIPKKNHSYMGYFNVVEENGTKSTGIVFGSPKLLKVLDGATKLHIDGTFDARPSSPNCRQLLIIHARRFDQTVAALFILTERKTTNTYIAMWNYIIGKVPELERTLKEVYSDFEAAIIAGTKQVFPRVIMCGCWYHYMSACTRKWRSLKLPKTEEGKICLRRIWAIPHLKADEFEGALSVIKGSASALLEEYPKLKDFFHHYESYWFRMAPIASVNNRWIRTNNSSEGFNKDVPVSIGRRVSFPHFSLKMKILVDSCAMKGIRVLAGNYSTATSKQEKNIFEHNQKIERNYWKLKNTNWPMLDFLDSVLQSKERYTIEHMSGLNKDSNVVEDDDDAEFQSIIEILDYGSDLNKINEENRESEYMEYEGLEEEISSEPEFIDEEFLFSDHE